MRPFLVVSAAACLALPLCATAGLKAGQWEITMKMDLGKDAPQMPQIPPEQLEKMKQLGIQPSTMGIGGPHTVKTCVSPQDAAKDRPPMGEREDRSCRQQDLKREGKTTTIKMVCDGEMKGTAEVVVTNDSPEHYTSNFHFVGSAHGHAVDMTHASEGRWVSASCN